MTGTGEGPPTLGCNWAEQNNRESLLRPRGPGKLARALPG